MARTCQSSTSEGSSKNDEQSIAFSAINNVNTPKLINVKFDATGSSAQK